MEASTACSPPHGVKRRAEEPLDNAQRLSKRFNLLNLDHSSNLYIPVDAQTPPRTPVRRDDADDLMQIEDTKDRVFIRDLDEELAGDSSPDDERIVFIPDIEKHLNRIPQHVLIGDQEKDNMAKQLVLYSVPQSLTLPESKDSVRKAIIESRARSRANQQLELAAAIGSHDALLHDEQEDPPFLSKIPRHGAFNASTRDVYASMNSADNDDNDGAMELD